MSDTPSPGPAMRLLLGLYPRAFRRRYGPEMAELYRWRVATGRRSGRRAALLAWSRATLDLAAGGIAERWGRRSSASGGHDFEPKRADGAMNELVLDLRHAARRLVRTPLFTVSAILIVALGIGANATMFTLVDALLFAPPAYHDPARVVHVYQDSDEGDPASNSYPATLDMATYTDVFSGVAAISSATLGWEAEDGPRRALIEYVTSSYFPVLGLQPAIGRWFAPEHDRVGAGHVAVVSHATWRSQFGSDPAILGRTIRMGGEPVTVIGVGPEGYPGTQPPIVTDFWLSISSVATDGPYRVVNLERREDHWYDVRARLAPGVSVAQAQAAMDALASRLAERFPDINARRGITVMGLGDVRVHPEADRVLLPAAAVLMGIVLLVLVLACTNLANLLIVRGIARGHEVALRRALGAGPARVARLFLLEALLLTLAGGVTGLVAGRWALGAVPAIVAGVAGALGGAGAIDLSMSGRVVLFTLALVLVTGVLFGLVPALQSVRSDLAGVLRDEGQGSSPGRRASWLRSVLVGVQVAASLVLLVGAGLLTRSLANVRAVHPGVDADRLGYVSTRFSQGSVSADEQNVRMRELLDRAASLPGVASAAFTSRLPLQPGRSTTTVVEGYSPPSGAETVELPLAVVSDTYFETVGIQVRSGRAFGAVDELGGEGVVIVNETAARRFWSDPAQAVGRRVRPQSDPDGWRRVVGVVADAKVRRLDEGPTPMLYHPVRQSPSEGYVLVRTDGDPAQLLPSLRAELRAVSPDLPLASLGTLESRMSSALLLPRIAAGALAAFSLVALVLASLGIYAVVAFAVARRTSELGIRIALGARRSGVVLMVMREMSKTVVLGLLAGLGLAGLATPVLRRVLFGVSPLDGVAFGLGCALLAVVAAVATYLPAARAARADPVDALRVQ